MNICKLTHKDSIIIDRIEEIVESLCLDDPNEIWISRKYRGMIVIILNLGLAYKCIGAIDDTNIQAYKKMRRMVYQERKKIAVLLESIKVNISFFPRAKKNTAMILKSMFEDKNIVKKLAEGGLFTYSYDFDGNGSSTMRLGVRESYMESGIFSERLSELVGKWDNDESLTIETVPDDAVFVQE